MIVTPQLVSVLGVRGNLKYGAATVSPLTLTFNANGTQNVDLTDAQSTGIISSVQSIVLDPNGAGQVLANMPFTVTLTFASGQSISQLWQQFNLVGLGFATRTFNVLQPQPARFAVTVSAAGYVPPIVLTLTLGNRFTNQRNISNG